MKRLPLRLALALVLCAALIPPGASPVAAATFSGQGLMYSAHSGGDAVAVDGDGNAYVVQTGRCPADSSQFGPWVIKLDKEARQVVYRTFLTCTGAARSIAVDTQGNAYVAGTTNPDQLQPTANFSSASAIRVAFVIKLNAAGQPVYAIKVGGKNTAASAIATDAQGTAYVTGVALSDDFPTTAGAYQRVHRGGSPDYADAFVFKLDPTGTRLFYSTFLGGTGDDYPNAIAADSNGNAYVAGYSHSADFPTTPGAYSQAGSEPFVTKLNAAGTALVYSSRFGGSAVISGLAVNAAGEASVCGYTSGDAIPTTAGASQALRAGQVDAYFARLDSNGAAVLAGTYLGGTDNDYARGIALDAAGNAYVVGTTGPAPYPATARALQASPQGQEDAFLTALDTSAHIRYSTRLGGAYGDFANAVAVDKKADAYVTGRSFSTDFPLTAGAVNTLGPNESPTFLAKLVPRLSYPVSALSSSVENASLGPSNAIDGNPQTRWSSSFDDGQSLYIDLGERVLIDRIVLNALAGGPAGAFGRYDLDYWGNCAFQSVQWAADLARESGTAVVVTGANSPHVELNARRFPSVVYRPARFNQHHLEIYILRGAAADVRAAADKEALFRVTADGAPLCVVRRGPRFSELAGRVRSVPAAP